jgi:hypothetical protein
MNNQMIDYERKGMSFSSFPSENSYQEYFRNPNDNPCQPNSIMSHAWCNVCEENHDEITCEIKRNVGDGIFSKNP